MRVDLIMAWLQQRTAVVNTITNVALAGRSYIFSQQMLPYGIVEHRIGQQPLQLRVRSCRACGTTLPPLPPPPVSSSSDRNRFALLTLSPPYTSATPDKQI